MPHIARRLFFAAGSISIIVGLGVGLYSVLSLRPRVLAFTEEFRRQLREADQAAAEFGKAGGLLELSMEAADSGARIAQRLTIMLDRLQDVVAQSAKVSRASGDAASATNRGLAGLALPDEPVERASATLRGAGRRAESLSEAMGKLRDSSARMAGQASAVHAQLANMQAGLAKGTVFLGPSRERLQAMDGVTGRLDAPTQVMLMGLVMSGIYMVCGMISLGLGMSLRAN